MACKVIVENKPHFHFPDSTPFMVQCLLLKVWFNCETAKVIRNNWNSPNLVPAIPFFPSLVLLVLLVVERVGEGCRFLTGTELGALPDGSHSNDRL
jgi:hypothetical protein